MAETAITNARIVMADAVVPGSLVFRDGSFAALDSSASGLPAAIDFDGDYLLPGFIELHTDNLEKHLQPRPGVMWPSSAAAVLSHDTQVAGAGITTVFDAVSVGEFSAASNRRNMIASTVTTVSQPALREMLRAEHFLHLRCELADAAMLDIYEPLADNSHVRLISLMDHTPGQRQWADVTKWRQFNRDKKWTDEEFAAMIAERRANQQKYVGHQRVRAVELARAHGTVMASHDDTTIAHVDEAVNDGIRISEFPTTLDAARHANAKGMKVVMGAPNIVRGGSHSGNVSAGELASEGLLDGLSSDYVPASLVQAAFKLARDEVITLPAAIALISKNPAEMVGLNDRGVIETGRRADFSRVRLVDDVPVVREVWREGRRIA